MCVRAQTQVGLHMCKKATCVLSACGCKRTTKPFLLLTILFCNVVVVVIVFAVICFSFWGIFSLFLSHVNKIITDDKLFCR